MFDLRTITRANVQALEPYSSARDEFSGEDGIFLDANENPYGKLNRYPDPYQSDLKMILSEMNSIPENQLFVGNGSDEIIDLLFRIFCNPVIDKALTFSPTYGMYDVSAAINDVELIKVKLNQDFEIELEAVLPFLSDPNLKLIFICSPNNPTGNCLSFEVIKKLLSKFEGIVCIDEAYIDFSDSPSFIELIDVFPNLVVTRTMSKAWGLAGARIGFAFSNPQLINLMNKVKPPYNCSVLNQQAASTALLNKEQFEINRQRILKAKSYLKLALSELKIVKKIYPSEANFFLVETTDANSIYKHLVREKVIVRNRNQIVRDCLRITVGTEDENQLLIEALKRI